MEGEQKRRRTSNLKSQKIRFQISIQIGSDSAAISGGDLGDGGDDVGKVGVGEVVVHGEGQYLVGQ